MKEACELVKNAVRSLGIEHGAFHCECMVSDTGVQLIELGARGGGGHIFGQIVEVVSGICMPQALVQILLGGDTRIEPLRQHGACYRFFAPPQGVFRAVSGLQKARSMPGVLDVGFSMAPGQLVEAIKGDASRPGFIVTTGSDRAEAIKRADLALSCITYEVTQTSDAINGGTSHAH
jgi:biotin carboxylase